MSSDMDAKLQKRKLDALKRGIHRVQGDSATPFAIHIVGLGKAGCDVVAQMLREAQHSYLSNDQVRLSALAIDINDGALATVREFATSLNSPNVQVEAVAINVPSDAALQDSLQRHRDFLKLEYPLYTWNPNYQPWLPSDLDEARAGSHYQRAHAKALYSQAYYDGQRPLAAALRRFRLSVESTDLDSVVCIVFGLGGGTGSGIAVDLARHLSTVGFGHRAVVVGIGIAPCDGDEARHRSGALFPVISELDCMLDHGKNQGVSVAFGELYRNPYTGGFIVVPQQPVWQATQNLAATHQRVDHELATLLTANRGGQLWETLRFLNWVAAPSTQHSAARTPFGPQWLHLWSFVDSGAKAAAINSSLLKQLGIRASYRPEIIEMRAPNPSDVEVTKIAADIDQLFKPEASAIVTQGGTEGSVQFILPRLSKTDLDLFFTAQSAYDVEPMAEKLLQHSWLLDLGVALCEPSTRLQGMAGASLWGGDNWVAVPYEGGIRISAEQPYTQKVA